MRKLLIFNVLLASVFTACAIHRPDVQQGNVLTKDMTEQLKPGISKRQVTFILGTPLVEDPFHTGRWDYLYLLAPGEPGMTKQFKRVTLYFKGDTLDRYSADLDVKMN
ncbi:MAG: outer membrane protein assembly factor BamE [Pseudomonadota bacterium]